MFQNFCQCAAHDFLEALGEFAADCGFPVRTENVDQVFQCFDQAVWGFVPDQCGVQPGLFGSAQGGKAGFAGFASGRGKPRNMKGRAADPTASGP